SPEGTGTLLSLYTISEKALPPATVASSDLFPRTVLPTLQPLFNVAIRPAASCYTASRNRPSSRLFPFVRASPCEAGTPRLASERCDLQNWPSKQKTQLHPAAEANT